MGRPKSVPYVRAIYGLHDGDGVVRYVGMTNYVPQRVGAHKYNAKKNLESHRRLPVYQWINEIGPENLQAIILEEIHTDDISVAQQAEQKYVSKFPDLLNQTVGGATNGNVRSGPSHHMYGKKLSEEHLRALLAGGAQYKETLSEDEKSVLIEKRREGFKKYRESLSRTGSLDL